jgi:hypothetical protein
MRHWLESLPRLVRLTLHGGLLLCALAIYGLSVSRRTIDLEPTQALTEAPLILYLFLLLRVPLRDQRWSSLAAAFPILWAYGVHDECWIKLGSVPNFVDFAMLPDFFVAASPLQIALTCSFIAAPLLIWLSLLDARPRVPRRALFWLALPAILATGFVRAAPARAYQAIDRVTFDEEWTDGLTADHWGRLYTLFMREIRRRSFSQGLSGFTPLARSSIYVDRALQAKLERRNVHVIVLESFIDVRLLRAVRFSEEPLAPSFSRLADPLISASVSPVFGGETARAEFEVLCGVPSLRLYALEFLSFSGAQTYCLPNILKDAGYHTVLSFPHGPVFFNTRRAYPGLGFEERIFGDEHSKPGQAAIKQYGQAYLHDLALFPQNLAKVRELVRAGKPFLNYMLTIYGHWPFEIDERHHPSRIEVSSDHARGALGDVRKISNQMRERTQALAAYVQGLREIDPNGLVVMVADHLPPLPGGKADYEQLGYAERDPLPEAAEGSRLYENFLLVVDRGQVRKLPLMRHFDLPHWILNELSHGAYCQEKPCDFGALPLASERYLDAYRTILGLAGRAP